MTDVLRDYTIDDVEKEFALARYEVVCEQKKYDDQLRAINVQARLYNETEIDLRDGQTTELGSLPVAATTEITDIAQYRITDPSS